MPVQVQRLTTAELLALPPTMSLETAGRAFGWGRTKSHELARADDFPCEVLRRGKEYVVTKAHLFESLGIPIEFLFTTDPATLRALADLMDATAGRRPASAA